MADLKVGKAEGTIDAIKFISEIRDSWEEMGKQNADMAEIRGQFSELNDHIATAISDKDFNRAVTLDRARQDILRDLCLMDMSGLDENFLPLLNNAKDNAELINQSKKR